MFDRALTVVRQYHRLNQSELADKLGLSRSYVNELEKGRKEPSLDVLKRYSTAFEIPVSNLMLFAEKSEEKFDGLRYFAADKVLKMLEWLADGVDGDGNQPKQKGPRTNTH